MSFPNAFVRLFVLIWLAGGALGLASAAWITWREWREQQRLPRVTDGLLMIFGSCFSWPFVVPFSLWAFILGGTNHSWSERAMQGRWPWPWWVSGATVLVLAVLIGLVVASITVTVRGH